MNTMKLTLGQAAKTAKRAKGTLSKALNNHEISAEKDDRGRWQIDPSELQRWMDANPFPNRSQNQSETPLETPENSSGNSALATEVKMLREQIEKSDIERERERHQLEDQIDDLRRRLDGSENERIRLNAMLTDQRTQDSERPRKGLLARLVG